MTGPSDNARPRRSKVSSPLWQYGLHSEPWGTAKVENPGPKFNLGGRALGPSTTTCPLHVDLL